MNKMVKKIFLGFLIFSLFGFGMICYCLYLMEIEDHYGDAQNLFYESEEGDIILNKSKKDFGLVTQKTWTRMYVDLKNEKHAGLYEWIYKNGNKCEIQIYHPTKKITYIENLSYSQLEDKIDNSEMELVWED